MAMGRVLIIAGSDSGGGAGIQADIKTVTMLSGYAATAITALTAQNTLGVFGVHEIPPEFIRSQIKLVLSDIGADAIKTGMLHDEGVIEAVAEEIKAFPGIPLILDPVMAAKGGAPLLKPESVSALKKLLLPMARIATPNIPEAEILSGRRILSVKDMEKAGRDILALGAAAALVKGGHMEGKTLTDLLVTEDGVKTFKSPRIETLGTHGTGCTLASAIASFLAMGLDLTESVAKARVFVRKAMLSAPGFGKGHGPLKHCFAVKPLAKRKF